MKPQGKLNLVSVGPGFADLIVPMAREALEESEAIVSYELYLSWVRPWIEGKQTYVMPLTKEKERALKAIELAREGRIVSLLSSGDIGIYAMATLAFEEMSELDTFEVRVVPGISAANSCASLLGAPLSHDFATLSLSDLLCPWQWIEERARHLAQADLAVALYNVQSRQRQDGVYRILKIFLEHKKAQTWCGGVRNAYREDQETFTCTLEELAERRFDMLTTVIIGNRFTQKKRGFIYTPRGYNSWVEPAGAPVLESVPSGSNSVWVFSGTSDGNGLADHLLKLGYPVVVSAASDYGREMVEQNHPSLRVRAGRMGVEARRVELRESGAVAIVDATHPFASAMSEQLMTLAEELELPYLRYERPPIRLSGPAIACASMEEAAEKAVALGSRIFLATGSKDLETFFSCPGAKEREWFARVTPDAGSIERALALGLSRSHLCAMQGPFSRQFNEMLWQQWKIDCVITKESGEAGGFHQKVEAAAALQIPILVIERPVLGYPALYHNFESLGTALKDVLR